MRVRCIANDVGKLGDSLVRERLSESIHREGPDADLAIGGSYSVLAIDRWGDGGLRVYLHTVDERDYPHPYPIEMFDVIDCAVPAGWCVIFERQPLGACIKRISFPEWANDDSFFERLVDGDEAAIAIYKERRIG